MTLTTAQAFDRFWDAVLLDSAMSGLVTQRSNTVDAVTWQAFPSTMGYQNSYRMG